MFNLQKRTKTSSFKTLKDVHDSRHNTLMHQVDVHTFHAGTDCDKIHSCHYFFQSLFEFAGQSGLSSIGGASNSRRCHSVSEGPSDQVSAWPGPY